MILLIRDPHLFAESLEQCVESLPKDCVLVCRGGTIEAHRMLLACASSFFRQMLAHKADRISLPYFDVEDTVLDRWESPHYNSKRKPSMKGQVLRYGEMCVFKRRIF
ncbi:hypothetical protein JTE90_005964 [Oedothorax gibbosus]|uniref:BTB domain-containing protein n=1 Tax=Oedothorax gibbosus TaxID=931172 RepID=A0AAV6UWN8_9ARAC|nr:hypothetical protein JTE90_005964 [Oedothorax gibbosus]